MLALQETIVIIGAGVILRRPRFDHSFCISQVRASRPSRLGGAQGRVALTATRARPLSAAQAPAPEILIPNRAEESCHQQ